MKRSLAFATLQEMRHLGENWDSYGAVPIDPRAIDCAVSMLDSLSGDWIPVPLSDGGVQLELLENGFDIEIAICTLPAREPRRRHD